MLITIAIILFNSQISMLCPLILLYGSILYFYNFVVMLSVIQTSIQTPPTIN